MRVLVFGGRDYRDYGKVCEVLDNIHSDNPISLVIEGGASGADTLGWKWAKNKLGKGNSMRFDARWDIDGRAAGPIRNQRMIDEGNPDLGVGFPGGKGTQDMASRLKKAGIPVIQI